MYHPFFLWPGCKTISRQRGRRNKSCDSSWSLSLSLFLTRAWDDAHISHCCLPLNSDEHTHTHHLLITPPPCLYSKCFNYSPPSAGLVRTWEAGACDWASGGAVAILHSRPVSLSLFPLFFGADVWGVLLVSSLKREQWWVSETDTYSIDGLCSYSTELCF